MTTIGFRQPHSRPMKASDAWYASITTYRALKKRVADALGRGDRDYSTLTKLSQEIGLVRGRIQEELRIRRQKRAERRLREKGDDDVRSGGSIAS